MNLKYHNLIKILVKSMYTIKLKSKVQISIVEKALQQSKCTLLQNFYEQS